VGVLIDGCPAGLALSETDIQPDLDRRRPGMSEVATSREESDKVEIWSGIFLGRTTGAPLCMVVRNEDANTSAYESIRTTPRPGHADYTSYIKYGGYGDYRGGGRFSGRITAGWVMAGAVAKKLLAELEIQVVAYTVEIGDIKAATLAYEDTRTRSQSNPVYCPDPLAAEKMINAIMEARQAGDSLGGVIEVVASNVPPGWGEPLTDTLDGELAKAMLSIPAIKGVEFGAGFEASRLRGSENNDPFIINNGSLRTLDNNAGGILGGISNGMPIVARVAVKPTPSIAREQRTVNLQNMTETTICIKGRHDPCIVPRAVVVVEAIAAIILCDFGLRAGALPRIIK
jgi:chorismate synthase